MKKTLSLSLLPALALLLASSGFCGIAPIQPVQHVTFQCISGPTDNSVENSLVSVQGTDVETIEANMVIYGNDGMPTPGCTPQIIQQITRTGYYCDGHFLANYQLGNDTSKEVDEGTASACQSALASEPSVSWP